MKVLEDINMGFMPMGEVDADDVNLSSFSTQDNLNPKLWHNGKIDSDVRLQLLEIADDFVDTLSVDWVKPKDVLFTGSLANYNWSEYSDIDMHIQYDFEEIYENTDFVDDYFRSKRSLWNEEHEKITICGYPVEISVEDVNTPCKSTGVYSLEENEWIKEPKHLSDEIFDKDYVKETSAEIMTKIDDMEDELKNGSSIKRMKEIYRSADRLFDRLKDMRKKSLETKAGEMASDNIVWKVLRRAEYVGKLKDIINLTYDKTHSL
jgi:hypothetical protein